MIRITLTAAALLALAAPALANDAAGNWKQDLQQAQQGPHGQHWRDAGEPWKKFGHEFKAVGNDVGRDFMTIGPATRENFRGGPRWKWSPDSGGGAQRGEVLYQDQYQAAPAQPQYYPTQPQYVPQQSYTVPTETIIYAEPVQAYAPVETYAPAEQVYLPEQQVYQPQPTYAPMPKDYGAPQRAPLPTIKGAIYSN